MNALVKSQRRSFAVILFLCMNLFAGAQITANFTATPQSGCSPLIVQFTDISSGNPTQWKWDLGNGAVSTLQNPSATYFNPGTYTVKLVAKNGNQADSVVKTQFITVYANPVAKFGASDTVGCFPLTVHFSDSSIAGSGTISNWQWDFGDGTISSQQHPTHTYTTPGHYTVTLKVTNSFGCVKSLTKTQYMEVSEGVNAAFSHTASGICAAPSTVQFTNTSTGPGTLSYQWNFGDGATSTAANPNHSYTSNGNYTVTLIAKSTQGCSDTLTMPGLISVGMHHADFNAMTSACTGKPVVFTNTSGPTPVSVQWNFGDGTTSSNLHPNKIYATPGVYTVKLVADFGGCFDSVTKQINITAAPQASFLANETVFCKVPANVQFNAAATGVSYHWDFGDGQTSASANPLHTYTNAGIFSVRLIVTNAAGCSDTLTKQQYVQIKPPVIQLLEMPKTGCVPLTANFSANVSSTEAIQSWNWNFGDGTTSTQPTPSHVYTNAGNYNITLVVTTVSGCKDSVTMVNGVRAGNKPNADFIAAPPQVCNMSPVQFTDNSTGNVDQWLWDFGDTYTSTEQNPLHVFGDIGVYTVKLIVWSNTCPDTIEKIDIVKVLPPIAAFKVEHDCDDKYTKKFKDESTGATSWLWDFGDGNTSTAQSPVHTYAAPGNYFVVLKVRNDSCWNLNNMWVKVIDEHPVLQASDVICKGMTEHFTVPSVNPANITSWQWNFGDGHTSQQAGSVSHKYDKAGTYIVSLTIKDALGCFETVYDTVHVYGPTAGFAPGATAACFNGNQISFTDTSKSDGQHNIVEWIWHYGDGTIHTSDFGTPVSHSYNDPGEYNVALVVKDNYGCSDTVDFGPVIIAKPVAAFTTPDSLSCTGKTISFTSQSAGYNLQYAWNFGDGTSSTKKNPTHQYASTGTYQVSLVVTDQYGCQDSVIKPGYITISMPKAAFTISDSIGSCPPLMVHFTNNATSYIDFSWDFGDGGHSTLQNPSHYYTSAGTFYPRLIVTGHGGCTDTAYLKVVVKGPSGNFTYTPVGGCNPLTVNFTLNSQNASSFVWDFSDGNTLPSLTTTATHTYTTAGDYIPKLVLVDTAGCSVPIIGADTIRVHDVTAGFETNVNTLCDAGSIYFTNTTVANDYIVGYEWNFGDGGTSTDVNPIHHYAALGTYTVSLVAITANGCTDTISIDNAVTVLEKPEINIVGDENVCVPATVSFSGNIANGSATWAWNFGNGQTSAQQQPAPQTYNADGDYTITAIATAPNGCKDTALHTLAVHPLPPTNAGPDQAVCKGSSIQLHATGATTYNWSAASSLSCLDCASPVAAPTDDIVYVVTGTSVFGCVQKDSVRITVHQPFVLNISKGDTICAGEKVTLSADGADNYSWYPSAGIQNPSAGSTSATPTTTTTYYVVATDNYNCFTDTASVFIKVWPIPTVDAGVDHELVVGDALQLNATGSQDVVAWQWTPAGSLSCATCPTTLAKPKQSTQYTVRVKNGGGCTAEDRVSVKVICNNGNLFIPNTFSPNGDGVNDRFFPSGKGINMIKSLRIFNRWGEVVFEKINFSANDAAAGWDGTYKGQILPPDVYIYSCEVVCLNNETLSYKGDITLLR